MYCGHETTAVQQRVRTYAAQPDADAFFDLLTGPRLLERVTALAPKQRQRLFPQMKTLSMFCTQVLSADHSCQQAVDAEAIKRLAQDLPLCSTAPAAIAGPVSACRDKIYHIKAQDPQGHLRNRPVKPDR